MVSIDSLGGNGDVALVRGVYRGQSGQRLSVDVKVRPALDDEGHEQVSDVPKPPPEPQMILERPQQPQQ
jgi:hypothetical protein